MGGSDTIPYITIQTQTQPAFYDRANTLQNRDMFMRLLESLHTLGYVTEVSTFVLRHND